VSTAGEPRATDNGAYTVSLVVQDRPGVLSRISLIFARRSFNIESLAVSPGAAEGFARMTITSRGAAEAREQIIKQLAKLIDVIYITDHDHEHPLEVEVALLKVRCDGAGRERVLALAREHGASVSDESEGRLILTAHGETAALDRLVAALAECRVEEVVRSGKIVIDRGASHFAHLLGGAG
jgi:acetolactate synthase-1/3 small subunit